MIVYEFGVAWLVAHLRLSDRAGNLVEYAIMMALIAMVCVLAVTFIGKSLSSKFSSIGSGVSG